MRCALLIDDDPLFARDLGLLFPADVALVHAIGSVTGIELADRLHPSVVFVDLCMPAEISRSAEEEGLEVIRRLVESQSRSRIVAISAFLTRVLERRCLALGAVLCLRKPVNRSDVEAALAGEGVETDPTSQA